MLALALERLFGLLARLISKLNPRDAARLGAAHGHTWPAAPGPHVPLGSLQRLPIADTQRPPLMPRVGAFPDTQL